MPKAMPCKICGSNPEKQWLEDNEEHDIRYGYCVSCDCEPNSIARAVFRTCFPTRAKNQAIHKWNKLNEVQNEQQ